MVMAEYATRKRTPIQVGFYDILQTIGRGNFAVVKLARHRITKTEVAIKIIDKLRLDQLNLKKIYREIQILKLLNHQHIIKLYQVMETSSTIYLVCEYARNGELFDYITEKGRLPEEKAKKMFWQVLTAVEYCHKNNVVHRDLKAENLLLDSNNNIKLADFGFSNFYQSGNMLSTWCGSPPYAAPEVFEGKVYEGPHLDVWSLGVVLYVLVCGTFPFDGSNLATLKDRVLGGRFRIPYWMSQDCENLVRRMLVINPKKRLTIAQIKKHKWMEAHNSSLILTKSSPLLHRRGKLSEYNEHVLKIMQGLGITRHKTLESLNLSAYDHLFAIYHLLSDRLKVHRTSFPPDTDISYESGRRRPSNIADQALTLTTQVASSSGVHQEMHGVQTNSSEKIQDKSFTVPEVQFNDMTTGLPTVQRSIAAPVRYSSPPLPQIKTSLYEENNEAVSYGSPPNPTYLPCQNEENLFIPNNNSSSAANQFTSANYHQRNVEMEETNLGNYNLQQRRHTLMVPSPSQMQMLRAGMSAGNQELQQLTPHTSASQLNTSREEMASSSFTGSVVNYFTFQDDKTDANNCEGNSCNFSSCVCKQSGSSYKTGNLLVPCKNLPTSSNYNYDRRKMDTRNDPQARRRSGVSHIMTNTYNGQVNDTVPELDTPEAKAAFIIKQRQQLDTSPIGFREGRRASDGLLLLGDNMLKEHLQKLARTKAVPEMTMEDSSETWKSNVKTQTSHYLRVPTPVNRTNSAERAHPQSSPGTTPVGSGSNISYQPYNNNQSLARRRSLQAQHLQIRFNSANQQAEIAEPLQSTNPKTSSSPLPIFKGNTNATEQTGFLQIPETESSFQWSSWKSVPGINPSEGVTEQTPTTWQKLTNVKAGNNWNEGDLSALAAASDEALPSKAAAAQQQQQLETLTKPLRQQSLPISPTTINHPFGPGQHQSMAQILQQRRLQRKLHIAASYQHQQTIGYQLPLPELEQLKIDNTGAFRHYQNMGNNSTENLQINPYVNEQEWGFNLGNQGIQYANATLSHEGNTQVYSSEAAVPNGLITQEMHAFTNSEHVNVKPFNYQTMPNQGLFANSLPIANMDGQFSWSYDASSYYRKSFEFRKDIISVSENLSNSAERLKNSSTDNMEFAMY